MKARRVSGLGFRVSVIGFIRFGAYNKVKVWALKV